MAELTEPDSAHLIQEAACAVLHRFGYKSIVNKKKTSVLFDAQTPGTSWWRSRLVIFEDSKVLTAESFVTDALYAPARREWVLELCCRATEAMHTGCFIFNHKHGWATYRTFHCFAEDTITEERIEGLLNSLSYPLRVWEAAFEYRHTPTSPESALEAALFRLDGLDGGVSDPTRRALIKVSSNEGPLLQEHGAKPHLMLT